MKSVLQQPPASIPNPFQEGDHKLQLFRSIRFIAKAELIYTINDLNHITLPLLILEYQSVKFDVQDHHHHHHHREALWPSINLREEFPVQLTVRYKKQDQLTNLRQKIDQILLPIILIFVLITTIIRLALKLRRRRYNTSAMNELAMDSCPPQLYDWLREFLYLASGHLAIALLIVFLTHISSISIVFLTQTKLDVMVLPLLEDDHQFYLENIILWALGLQVFLNPPTPYFPSIN